jgi:hypothetical protein
MQLSIIKRKMMSMNKDLGFFYGSRFYVYSRACNFITV